MFVKIAKYIPGRLFFRVYRRSYLIWPLAIVGSRPCGRSTADRGLSVAGEVCSYSYSYSAAYLPLYATLFCTASHNGNYLAYFYYS